MENYINIGKAVLIRATGIQKNTKHIVEDMSLCNTCQSKAIYEAMKQECPHKAECMKTVYVNEKNKVGYQNTLKTNAIKIFIYLHTCKPDKDGQVSMDTREAASLTNSNEKTIAANLSSLQGYGYITYTKAAPHKYNVIINDYKNYYKPASKGGRGFLVINRELFGELMKIDSLNLMRITIRQIIELDNQSANGTFNVIEKSYRDIKLSLPEYCKPNVIRRAITHVTDIFHTEIKNTGIRFILGEKYNAKKQKNERQDLYSQKFLDFFSEFNAQIVDLNTNQISIDQFKYQDFLTENTDQFRLLGFTPNQIVDMVQMAMQYSYELVVEALKEIYKNYKLKTKRINNIGGLIRTIITAAYEPEIAA